MMQVTFTFILVIGNVIRKKYKNKDTRKQDLIHLMEYLSEESNLTMDLNKLKEINNRANNDLQSVIMDLLNSKPIFKTSKLKEIENDIGLIHSTTMKIIIHLYLE